MRRNLPAAGRRRRRGRSGLIGHALAADELEHRAQRALGLAELAQQAPRRIDLLAGVVDAGDDHPAGLHLGVERLEVRTAAGAQGGLDLERPVDLVADLLA